VLEVGAHARDVDVLAGLGQGVHEVVRLLQVALEIGLRRPVVVPRVGELPVDVAQLRQAQRRLDRAVAVPPPARRHVEAVLRHELPAVVGDEGHGLHDVAEDLLGHEVVEVHPHPAGLDALAAVGDLALELVAALEVDAEQPVAVGAGARAAAAALDPEQVVEHGHDEVVVQVAAARAAHGEGHDREPLGVEVAEDVDRRMRAPCCDGTTEVVVLVGADDVEAHAALEVEDEPGADRLDDRGGACLLPVDRVGEVHVLGGVDVGHRAAADDDRYRVRQQVPADREHPGRAGAAHELVRRQHDRVLARERVLVVALHVDREVRRRGGVVPEGQRPVLVQQA